jgi:cell division septation protein DedD
MKKYARILAVVGWVLVPTPGAAQDLGQVEALALSGQAEEARELLSAWWDGNFEDATRIDRQKGLWLRGLLTVDPDLAELDFQRLVVEYPGGPFTAEALVRLGGAAEARREFDQAERHFRTLLRDYPGSRYQTLAQGWLTARAAAQPEAPSVAEISVDVPPPPSAEPEAVVEDTLAGSRETPATTASGAFAVQLGAFSSEVRALTLSKVAAKAGFDVRVVQVEGNSLFRVRLGRYATEDEAESEMVRVVEEGFEATVVRNADREGA